VRKLEMDCLFYHRTTAEAADSILRNGFRDGAGTYMTGNRFSGVWLSDRPLDCNEGATGDVLLRVTLPDSVDISDYYWDEGDEKPYKEWDVPASIINAVGEAERYSDEDYWESTHEGV
jgi:hypothetical protein